MAKITDFETIRKKHKKKLLIKRVFFLSVFFIVFAMGFIFFGSDTAMTALSNYINQLFATIQGGNGFPAVSPGGSVFSLEGSAKSITLLNDTNLYVYNFNAKQINNIQHGLKNPAFMQSSNKIMMYDSGGKNLFISPIVSNDMFQKNHDFKLDTSFTIFTADINARNDFAIVTASQQYIAEVTAYNNKYEEVYKWSSSEKLINTVSMKESGDMMSVGCVGVKGGMTQTTMYVFKFSMEKEIASINLNEDMLVSAEFKGNDIHVITDKEAIVLSEDGKILGQYHYGGEKLSAFCNESDEMVLVLGNFKEDKKLTIKVIDSKGNEKKSVVVKDNVKSISSSKLGVALLLDNEIAFIPLNSEEVITYEASEALNMTIAGDNIYYITAREIKSLSAKNKVLQKEPSENMSSSTTAAVTTKPESSNSTTAVATNNTTIPNTSTSSD